MNPHLQARLCVMGLAGITGTNYLVMKIVVEEISPTSVIFWRFLFASLFLLLTCSRRIEWKNSFLWREGGITGILLGIALLLLAIALSSAGSGETAFWVSSDAAFIPIFSFLFFRELPQKRTLVGTLLAMAGLALLSVEHGFEFRQGSLIGILSALTFAVWIMILGRIAKRYDPVALGFTQMASALCLLFLVSGFWSGFQPPSSVSTWAGCIYLGALGTGLRFAVQSYLQRTVSPAETALIYLVEPVFAAFLGYLFLGEYLHSSQILGCALILVGISYSQFRPHTEELPG